jgi:hypothetical protein
VGIRIKLASRNNRGSRKVEDTSRDPEARDIQLIKQIQIKRRTQILHCREFRYGGYR